MQIFLNFKKTYKLFKKYRLNGASVLVSLLMVFCRISSFILTKYNVYENDAVYNVQEKGKEMKDSIEPAIDFEIYDKSTNKVVITTKNPDQMTFIWFIPHCSNIWGGGHYTLFRFINYFTTKHNINSIISIYNAEDNELGVLELQNDLNKAFATDKFVLISDYKKLPDCDVAIATTWQSAYFAQNKEAAHKFYFMQDYESLFYPAGTPALQANYTYSFGFYGITGGNWLKSKYESYGYEAQAYVFSADRNIFYPPNTKAIVRDTVKRIFFYGRPSTPRRSYELGIKSLEMIAIQFPDIELVIAGLSGLITPRFKCTLLGNLSLKETGDLYRTCDIGIALSATNMSYLPVELMASGCPVISNFGEQVEWYCKDNYNSLLVAPVPSALLNAVISLIESKELRQKLVFNGLHTIEKTTWDNEMEKIYQYIIAKCNS